MLDHLELNKPLLCWYLKFNLNTYYQQIESINSSSLPFCAVQGLYPFPYTGWLHDV